jgi:1-acyl-sn-glycerol-3-phosphate acyltransferase
MPPIMNDKIELDRSQFAQTIRRMIGNSQGDRVVTEKNVYQEGNPSNKPLMREIVTDLMLPGSQIIGFENLAELHQLAQRKKPCLILMEHFSNFDIPCLYELLERRGPEGKHVADAIVSVAGVKLNETGSLVLAFTEIFTRVVLYPSRSMDNIMDPKERKEALKRRAKLNMAAMKALMKLRKDGRIILVFPTGTRYRPWDPSTGRGLKEINSYLKFYSYMVNIAINGNTLLPNPNGNMEEDFPNKDVMIYTVSPVTRCAEFRREALKTRNGEKDPKQHVADQVMAALAALHEQTEKIRRPLLDAPQG